jgi:hypothetical protein
MPWHVVENHPACPMSRPFGVEKDDDGEVEGCHATRDEANEQMAALYASEDTRSAGMRDTKALGVATVEFKAAKKDNGKYDFTLSVPTTDRDEEVVDALAFAPLPGWIPIDVDHGMTVLSTVGSGTPVYVDNTLKLDDFAFASTPLAKDVQTLVDEGHIRKLSVAFMNAVREKDEKDGKVHIRSAELLNAAIVAIPSNREADILVAAKALAEKVGARNSAADADRLQAAHDLMTELGAACVKHAPATDEKSTGTDPEDTAAAPAAAEPPAEVTVARAHAFAAEALLLLTD